MKKKLNEKIEFETKLKVEYIGKDKLFLHREIGKGTMPDGRKCRLIMINSGVMMEVTNKSGKGWKHFAFDWMDLSEAIVDVIPKLEALLKTKTITKVGKNE